MRSDFQRSILPELRQAARTMGLRVGEVSHSDRDFGNWQVNLVRGVFNQRCAAITNDRGQVFIDILPACPSGARHALGALPPIANGLDLLDALAILKKTAE